MHPAFASVFLAQCPRVCGWRLVPLQLGHAALLEAVGSPFFTGDGVITSADIVAAAWACSRPATVAMTTRRRWWERPKIGAGLMDEISAFREYLAFHMQAPRRLHKQGAAGCRVPWQWLVAWRLCGGDWRRMGEAWNTPLLLATARCFTEDAAAGDETILDEQTELLILNARKQAAANG